MLTVKLEGMSAVEAQLRGVAKQAAFANVVALNRAAFAGRAAVQREMSRVFDRPTPWVLNAPRVTKATKAKPAATIDFTRDGNKQGVEVSKILSAEIYGGDRRQKRFERALSRIGILPSGWIAAPGPGAQRDAYGNVPASQINQILSFFAGFGEQGYKANMTDKTRGRLKRGTRSARGMEYFVVQPGRPGPNGRAQNLAPGIYQRTAFGSLGKAIKPVFFFAESANYARRFDFYSVADKAARAAFAVEWPKAFEQAMRTAR